MNPVNPPLRLPLSSGSFVQLRAQCPVCPHLAHLVRLIRNFFVHFLGLAVFRGKDWLGGGGTVEEKEEEERA